MNKKQTIAELSKHGIEELYGKTLSGLEKRELEKALRSIQSDAPKHLSHTQVSMYHRCGLQYYYRYKRGMKRPPGAVLTLGSAVEAGEDYNYRQKIESGQDEPLDVLTDIYHEDFATRKDDTDWQDDNPDTIESMGRSLIEVYREELAPITKPLAVQGEYEIAFSNESYTFKAFIDLIADFSGKTIHEPVIIDHKTAARTPSQSFADASDQLTAYAACMLTRNGNLLPVGIDALVKTKAPKAVRLRSARTKEDINRYWKTVQATWEAIQAGIFLPAPTVTGSSANWVCSPKFCGYWSICHEEF